MHSRVSGNTGWLVGLGFNKHFGAVSALVFSLVLSACGGGSGSDNPGPARTGAPALSVVSMASGELTTVTVGDKVTVSISASEAILAPSVMVGGVAVDRVVGSGKDWTADRVMLETDTAGVLSLSVAFKDVGGEAGATVVDTTDGTAITFEINSEGGAVVDGPFQAATAFADYNGNGVHDEGEPSDLTDANGEYDLVKTTDAPAAYNIVVEMTADTIDSISGESYADSTLKLKAPSGGDVVTPLTTVLVAAQAADPTFTAEDLAIAMGLPAGIDVETYNPFASGVTASEAHAVEKVFQQVMTAMLIVAEAMEGVAGITGATLSGEDASTAALLAVTNMITESTVTVDFSESDQIAKLQEAAKDELLARGIVDEASAEIADYVLASAADTVTQLSVAIQAVALSDFGEAASSSVSLLKHDAASQMAALATAAADFLEAGSTDLTQLDITEILTLASADGVAAMVEENQAEVDAYLATLGGRVLSWGLFGEVQIADGGVFNHPASAQSWGGFFSETDIFPLAFSVGGTVTFNAALQAGSDPVSLVFQFEEVGGGTASYNFQTEGVVVDSETEATYTALIPAQEASLTYESLVLFISGLDSPVQICNVQVSTGDTVAEGIPCESTGGGGGGDDDGGGDDGTGSSTVNITLSVGDASPSAVTVTSKAWGWDPAGDRSATDNGDGTWTVAMDAPATAAEYVWKLDGVAEVLWDQAGTGLAEEASCGVLVVAGTLVTDYWSYSNRVLLADGGDRTEFYDSCDAYREPLPIQEIF